MAQPGPSAIEAVFKAEHGRAVALLTRLFGDIDLAQDAVQEAFTAAVERWPAAGLPPSPAGWIITTARRRAIDRLRREARSTELLEEACEDPAEELPVEDERLRLIFTCCHPALAAGAQVALTLQLLCGFTAADIARAFLVPEAAMAQRLVRAKRKIREARIPYRVPEGPELNERLKPVLAVLYLLFNEGYSSGPGREGLCAEALGLGRVLCALMPEAPEAWGLLALMLLVESRRAARVTPEGAQILLAEQDRQRWDRALIAEGQSLVRRCLRVDRPGPYQLQAAIQAVHSDAERADYTDWTQILQLYDQLSALAPSPVVALNRAVAVAELEGAEAALALVDPLELQSYPPFHAVRAELLRRLGRDAEAARAYEAAIQLNRNPAEQELLWRRRESLG